MKADAGLVAALAAGPLEVCIFNEVGFRTIGGSTVETDLIGTAQIDLWPLVRSVSTSSPPFPFHFCKTCLTMTFSCDPACTLQVLSSTFLVCFSWHRPTVLTFLVITSRVNATSLSLSDSRPEAMRTSSSKGLLPIQAIWPNLSGQGAS